MTRKTARADPLAGRIASVLALCGLVSTNLSATARAADDLAACQRELVRALAQAAEAERTWRAGLSAQELFALGEANPDAQKVLAPEIERILKGAHARSPSHSFECKRWACRLLVLETEDEQPRNRIWQPLLQRDPALSERMSGMAFPSPSPTKDPISGVPLLERAVFIALDHPSGKRDLAPAPPPRAAAIAPPKTLAACSAELVTARAQSARHREAAPRVHPEESFAKGRVDPALTSEFRAEAHASLTRAGLATAGLEIECRALVCRARWPNPPDLNWHNRLHRPSYRARVDGMMVRTGEAFVSIADGPRADGGAFLRALVRRVEASDALAACHARFPATGALAVKLELPAHEKDIPPGAASARYGDTLAGTPLGTCVEAEIARTILATPPPDLPHPGVVMHHKFRFPR